jgi:hypothetical protein
MTEICENESSETQYWIELIEEKNWLSWEKQKMLKIN